MSKIHQNAKSFTANNTATMMASRMIDGSLIFIRFNLTWQLPLTGRSHQVIEIYPQHSQALEIEDW
jgi:hypothetical protein